MGGVLGHRLIRLVVLCTSLTGGGVAAQADGGTAEVGAIDGGATSSGPTG